MKLHTTPTALELLAAVREFLTEQVMPATEGQLSFHARVAANVLSTVERELADPRDDTWASERLATVGASSEEQLCEQIRTASSFGDLPGVIAVLSDITQARLAASNPRYLEEVTDDDPTR